MHKESHNNLGALFPGTGVSDTSECVGAEQACRGKGWKKWLCCDSYGDWAVTSAGYALQAFSELESSPLWHLLPGGARSLVSNKWTLASEAHLVASTIVAVPERAFASPVPALWLARNMCQARASPEIRPALMQQRPWALVRMKQQRYECFVDEKN